MSRKFNIISIFDKKSTIGHWRWTILGWWLRAADWGGICWIANRIFAVGARPLNERERDLAQQIFKNSLNLDKIRLNEQSRIGKKMNVAFVTFNTIHADGRLSDDVFLHELMHVWQYQNVGAHYIAFCLAAQRSHEGYDYGGQKNLEKAQSIFDFNGEQQAQIVQDYFLLSKNDTPQYIEQNSKFLTDFESFLHEIQHI